MFICCKTKPKKDKQIMFLNNYSKSQKNGSTAANSDAESLKHSKCEEEIHKEPFQEIGNKSQQTEKVKKL